MKKYNVFALRVIKVVSGDNIRYLICKFNESTDTYIEILTKEKIKGKDISAEEPLSNYYSVLACKNYVTGEPLMLDKKTLLSKYIEINSDLILEENVNNFEEENKNVINCDSLLEKATTDFFPKTGVWYSHCFQRPNELGMGNLPCHLRDYGWLAQMLKKDQNLYLVSNKRILNFVKTSPFFEEKRHEYEQEIVKWQIQWIMGHGENWICDEKYGGDLVYITPVVDLGVRKGVVDTLSKIGISKDAIEEGLERNANLWRNHCMESAFANQYEPVFYLIGNKDRDELAPIDPEFKSNWLKMRKYEYYCDHKRSVDKYGVVEPEMLMSKEEVDTLKQYLEQKHIERMNCIEQYKEQSYGTSRTLKKTTNNQ